LRVIESEVSKCRVLDEIVARADAVYHLAAAVGVELVVKSPIHTIQANVDETEAVLNAASKQGTPVLICSTSEVYGKSQKAEFSEEDDLIIGPPDVGRWSYACSKLLDEFLALAHARERRLPVMIARLFNTVGPRQTGRYGMVLPRFIKAARAGECLRVYGDGAQTRCFCYVTDTVEALVRLQNCPQAAGMVCNVGGAEEVSIKSLAELVIAVLGSSSRIEFVPYEIAYAPGFEDMRRRRPSIERLWKLTGFRPQVTLDRIVRLTAAV
jgi:UDP-glucose 4-epimerase